MKYGEQLEYESVPQWKLHNVDYDSLKEQIKVHVTQTQATSIAIPGRGENLALRKFEDRFFLELCRQHERVNLFITSKVDEISSQLDSYGRIIDRWIGKWSEQPTTSQVLKIQRKIAKFERELLRVEDTVQALSRFVCAQVVAFRKIVKKYEKWTGSTTLGARFSEEVLINPESIIRRDFNPLQRRHDEILQSLRDSLPQLSEMSSPSSDQDGPSSNATTTEFEPLPPPSLHFTPLRYQSSLHVKYWNEYDDGSEAGGPEDDYAILVEPDGKLLLPGLGYVLAVLHLPVEKFKYWLHVNRSFERQPLLREADSCPVTTRGNFSSSADLNEEGCNSLSGNPAYGFVTDNALVSTDEQEVLRYRENILWWVTVGCYAASFALLAISGALISTGRPKLRMEIDATITFGAACSLLVACSALGATLCRRDHLTMSYRVIVGSTFVASCLSNGMLLVLVVGNAP